MLKKLVLIAFVTLSINIAMAQGTPGGGTSGGGGLEPDPGNGEIPTGAVPVDGGLVLLLAAGAGFGAKQAYDYRKNKVKSEK